MRDLAIFRGDTCRNGREEGLQGKHYCFSSPIHMQLRLGIMLQSGLSELHSCTEKVH